MYSAQEILIAAVDRPHRQYSPAGQSSVVQEQKGVLYTSHRLGDYQVVMQNKSLCESAPKSGCRCEAAIYPVELAVRRVHWVLVSE